LTTFTYEFREDLLVLTELIEAGKVTPVIDRENERPPQGANVARSNRMDHP
jgi:hypothetical protein